MQPMISAICSRVLPRATRFLICSIRSGVNFALDPGLLDALVVRCAGCCRPLLSIDVETVSTSPTFSARFRTLATCGWLVFVSFATVRLDFVGLALSS